MTENRFEIIKFDATDYTSIAQVHNELYPEYPMTANEFTKEDAERDSHCLCERWLATVDAQVVAHSGFCQYAETYAAGEFTLMGGVIPAFRKLGIGSALYERVLNRLIELKATSLSSQSRSDRQVSINFLRKRKFVELRRQADWELDVTTFDPTPYQEHIANLDQAGIKIYSVKELADDPQRDLKLYQLEKELLVDTPGVENDCDLPFERWVELSLNCSAVPTDGYFVAVANDNYIGRTDFRTAEADETLHTNLTGVIREYRRRGIALGLKLKAIAWANSIGCHRIMTGNESNNIPIVKLNKRLGFKKLPGWIFYERRFDR